MTPGGTLFGTFDASVLYGADNATPTAAAVGYHVKDGTTTAIERGESVSAFVSSSALEYRALLELVEAVADRFDSPSALYLQGDADDVVRTVDPTHHARPADGVVARRVATIRRTVAAMDVPTVTYRAVPRGQNERAHELARAAHRRDARPGHPDRRDR